MGTPLEQDLFRYRRVEKHILTLIESGSLKKEEKLPSLRQLSRQLQVSISTVSQAYLELEKKGVISSRERSGFFVTATARELPQPVSRPQLPMIPTFGQRSDLIQTVLEALGNHSLLPFGVVSPAEELLPGKTLTRLLTTALRADPAKGLNYTGVHGDLELRRQIAMRSLDAGITTSAEEILITSGALEGIAIALRLLTRPGRQCADSVAKLFLFFTVTRKLRSARHRNPFVGNRHRPRRHPPGH